MRLALSAQALHLVEVGFQRDATAIRQRQRDLVQLFRLSNCYAFHVRKGCFHVLNNPRNRIWSAPARINIESDLEILRGEHVLSRRRNVFAPHIDRVLLFGRVNARNTNSEAVCLCEHL